VENLQLNENVQIPILGFGTYQLRGDECRQAVGTALEVGYRHIDTADRYQNHSAIANAIRESGVARQDIFLTTKIWWDRQHYDQVMSDANRFLEELQTDYIDLLLIHWPNRKIPLTETVKAFTELKDRGVIKAIGVSNFNIHHLTDALNMGLQITNNQIEFHPSLNQKEMIRFANEHRIVLTAYSPLAQGQDLNIPLLLELAEKYHRSVSQVILNWIMSKNIVAIPRSSSRQYIEDNFQSLRWQLGVEDIEKIDQIGGTNRINDPGFGDFKY
jgi:2,5-diketo-D-gluconate reductase B